jgi:hypothetical protein
MNSIYTFNLKGSAKMVRALFLLVTLIASASIQAQTMDQSLFGGLKYRNIGPHIAGTQCILYWCKQWWCMEDYRLWSYMEPHF